ncbi:MAG: hypothetical protein J7L82_06265 [Staphylothermus sp.]|nr:hypothetical protein [Staphylothermus sp.]
MISNVVNKPSSKKYPLTSGYNNKKRIPKELLTKIFLEYMLDPNSMGLANTIAILNYIKRKYPKIFYSHSREYLRKRIISVANDLANKGYIEIHHEANLNTYIMKKLDRQIFDLILYTGKRETEKPKRSKTFTLADRRARHERSVVQHVLYEKPKLDSEEKESLTDYVYDLFLSYIRRIARQVLVFYDSMTDQFVFIKQKNRYVDPNLNRDQLKKFLRVFSYYAKKYKVGVFLTITFPPIFPLGLYPKLATYVVKQLMAWIRKHNPNKEIKMIRVNEFQDNGMLHVHLVIFGVDYICEKEELTVRLDVWLVNALLRLYKYLDYKLVNLMIARYLRYCRSHKKYVGPINFLTKVDFQRRLWNLPPDLRKWIENIQKQTKLFNDGAGIFVDDYLAKYLSKYIGISEAISDYISSGFDSSVLDEIKDKIKSLKFLMYWITGIRYFTLDYRIYKKLGLSKKKGSGILDFVGSYSIENLPPPLWELYKTNVLNEPEVVLVS